jgi:L-serine dehydratase
MGSYPDFFNDVFGPVMQPGSSSHMAGPCRLGRLAADLLGERPARVEFIIDWEGSFAGTFGTMNEDKGLLAGVIGLGPDDDRIFSAPELAMEYGVKYDYLFAEMKESDHANAVKFVLYRTDGSSVSLVGDSTGGGRIRVRKIDGFPVDLIGDSYVVLIFSPVGDKQKEKIENFSEGFIRWALSVRDGDILHFFFASAGPELEKIKSVLPGARIELLKPVLPVVARKDRRPQLFSTVEEWLDTAKRLGISVSEAAVRYEMDSSLWSRDRVVHEMVRIKEILLRQITAPLDGEPAEPGPFCRDDVGMWSRHQAGKKALSGALTGRIVQRAMGVNTKRRGIPVVPGPMGTGGGYLFSALYSVKEAYGFTEDDLLRGLFVAAGIGALAYTHTNPTGEVVGCAGECGVCCAMAAAAITEMAGGSEKIGHAASLALQAFIGIPCDPVIGGYEVPCYSRIMTAASMAVVFADLALAGVDAVIPYDEMLQAIDTLGRNMPSELLCTSSGGCCVTPAAKRCEREYRQHFLGKEQPPDSYFASSTRTGDPAR